VCYKAVETSTNNNPAPASIPTSCAVSSKKKRTLKVPGDCSDDKQGRLNNFIESQIDEAKKQGNIVPLASKGKVVGKMGVPSSKQIGFGNKALVTGMEGLQGCSSIIIVAKQGIWISHLWELPGFLDADIDPTNGEIVPGSRRIVTDAEFREGVLDFLHSGGSDDSQNFPGLDTSPGTTFGTADELLKIWIVHPRGGDTGGLIYPAQIDQIKAELGNMLPKAKNVAPEVLEYFPVDPNDEDKEFLHGTIVVQYDPKQQPEGQQVRLYCLIRWSWNFTK
jgi:hypothetical protein